MDITITGSLGNIGRRLTEQLTAKGHLVKLISRNAEKQEEIKTLGAVPAIGAIDDPVFLQQAFRGADAVFTMIPPSYDTTDARAYIRSAGEKYAAAIAQAGVRTVVNLSSIGAHLPEGAGPAGANHYVEEQLNALNGADVLHLRPGMFYTNFYGMIPMIRQQGIIGNNFDAAVNMVLTHPHDIADIAADALDNRSFSGKNIQYIAGDEKSGAAVAEILGAAIGRPELQWVAFPDEALLQGMLQNGLTQQMAEVYIIEVGAALRGDRFLEDYYRNKEQAVGRTRLADFAQDFARAWHSMP